MGSFSEDTSPTAPMNPSAQLQPDLGLPMPLSERDDRFLVHEVLNGSQAAFQCLIERYQLRIFRLLRRFTKEPAEIEDLAQDVFLKVYRKLDTFHFDSMFFTWMYRIAMNTAMDYFDRKRRNPVRAVEDPGVFERGERNSGAFSPQRNLMQKELEVVTQDVLARMPEKYRLILVLREYEDLPYEEMAQVLGCAMGTVESRLFRARAKFREILERIYPEYSPEKADSEERDEDE